ncbi:hypothetical protein ACJJIC_18765 [Microbulbifer sp. ANSA002]|uniref:hypothetical protein n=1 Tax=unclassified Microbulbifer TaxID=2619833 RepID=UPI004042069B
MRKLFFKLIKKEEFLKAALVKNHLSVILTLASVTWLIFFGGLELIFASAPSPGMKVATILIGYGTPLVNFIYGYKEIKIRHETYIIRRSNHGNHA